MPKSKTQTRARSLKWRAPKTLPPPNPFADAAAGRVFGAALGMAPLKPALWDGATTNAILRQQPTRKRLLEASSEQRKRYPVAAGMLDYFPDACAAVAEVSFHGNEKHNPGQPLHWSRGKSMDHADCIARHLIERGGFDGPIRHSAALAWRAMALLQEELEAEFGLASPRGARVD